ncbi:MAG: hypothetical protein L0206_08275 [Actinobacteria bacterium]|nr:hypothetical protein [Actinomycetota bacterium]
MKVYCRLHAQQLGRIRKRTPAHTWVEFVTLSPTWKAHHSAEIGHPEERANSFTNLSTWGRPEVEARGCDVCGSRMLAVQMLLEAFEAGRSKIVV